MQRLANFSQKYFTDGNFDTVCILQRFLGNIQEAAKQEVPTQGIVGYVIVTTSLEADTESLSWI